MFHKNEYNLFFTNCYRVLLHIHRQNIQPAHTSISSVSTQLPSLYHLLAHSSVFLPFSISSFLSSPTKVNHAAVFSWAPIPILLQFAGVSTQFQSEIVTLFLTVSGNIPDSLRFYSIFCQLHVLYVIVSNFLSLFLLFYFSFKIHSDINCMIGYMLFFHQ